MATIKSFEDLEVWQLARKLCQEVHLIVITTPLAKDYKLKEQLNGSSGSVMDNPAEGFERGGNKEFIQFLSIAKGSCGETRSQLYRVFDRRYIEKGKFEELSELCLIISKKIEKLIIYLKNSDFKGNKYLVKEEIEQYLTINK